MALISDDTELQRAFVAECHRQSPGLQVDCEDKVEQAFTRLQMSRRRKPDPVHSLVVADLGGHREADVELQAGVRFMERFERERLIGTVPALVLSNDTDAVSERWPSRSLLVSVERDRIPIAVAQARLLAGHLWPDSQLSAAELCLLIVDDDPVDAENIRRLVAEAGAGPWRILRARTGAEAISVARQNALDLVFLDYRLPDLSGAEILRRLRIDWAGLTPPVVSLTGAGSEQRRPSADDTATALPTPFGIGRARSGAGARRDPPVSGRIRRRARVRTLRPGRLAPIGRCSIARCPARQLGRGLW